jgi:crotonobetainyl-CoA:carnitine CoA-transferase CaiB-like acyl-CoA transferase
MTIRFSTRSAMALMAVMAAAAAVSQHSEAAVQDCRQMSGEQRTLCCPRPGQQPGMIFDTTDCHSHTPALKPAKPHDGDWQAYPADNTPDWQAYPASMDPPDWQAYPASKDDPDWQAYPADNTPDWQAYPASKDPSDWQAYPADNTTDWQAYPISMSADWQGTTAYPLWEKAVSVRQLQPAKSKTGRKVAKVKKASFFEQLALDLNLGKPRLRKNHDGNSPHEHESKSSGKGSNLGNPFR